MTNNNMYFIANWKMYGNIADISKSKSVVRLSNLKKFKKTKIIYCPPYTLLNIFYERVKNSNISIGAQNCHSNSEYGAFTGSVNAKLIKSSGAKFVILGHSENRKNGENDLIINKKIHSVLKENLNVIFCIGETLTEKKNKKTYSVLKKQITKGLKGIKKINITGRLQEISSGKFKNLSKKNKILVDGSHNILGAKMLSKYLSGLDCNIHMILGMMKNKDHKEYVDIFKNKLASLTTVDIPNQKNSIN